MHPIHVTAATYDAEVVQSDVPVLVDLWAPWCGPCHAVAPVLDELAVAHDGRLKVAKVNVDEEYELAARFGVQGIPTMLLLRRGEIIGRMVGAGPRQVIERELGIDAALAEGASA